MSINIRAVGEVADGSVTASKLATGAVDLGTDKVTGEAPTSKIAADAITNAKIAAGAVDTTELAADAVTNAKIAALAVDTAEIAADAVTNAKIGAGAVDTAEIAALAVETAQLAAGAVTDSVLADDSVVNSKLADLAISTGKLQNNVVTLAKSDEDSRLRPFIGDESTVSIVGTTETEIKAFKLPKGTTQKFKPKKMRVFATLKTDNVASAAELTIYLDAEGTSRLTLTSTSLTEELVSGEFDLSDLTDGRHDVSIRLRSLGAADQATNDYVDMMIVVEV